VFARVVIVPMVIIAIRLIQEAAGAIVSPGAFAFQESLERDSLRFLLWFMGCRCAIWLNRCICFL